MKSKAKKQRSFILEKVRGREGSLRLVGGSLRLAILRGVEESSFRTALNILIFTYSLIRPKGGTGDRCFIKLIFKSALIERG